jgi:hypothetical protein
MLRQGYGGQARGEKICVNAGKAIALSRQQAREQDRVVQPLELRALGRLAGPHFAAQ